MIKYLLLISVLFGSLSFANDRDNGGDICELRFKEIKNDFESWILRGDSEGLNLPGDLLIENYNKAMFDLMNSPITLFRTHRPTILR